MQFVQFQTLINCVTNEFLRCGYSLYGTPPLFPHPTTPGDLSTSRTNNSQVKLSFVFKSESRLLNMTQSLLCYGVLRVVRHPCCCGEDLPQPVDIPCGRHHLRQASGHHMIQAYAALPYSRIQVRLRALLPHSWVRVTGHHRCRRQLHLEGRCHRPLECLRG
jgi:hypothetical protein